MREYVCGFCGVVFSKQPSFRSKFCGQKCYGLSKRADPVSYFAAHIEKTDGCWLWTGERIHTGYGHIPRSFRRRVAFGTEIKAHRIAWILANGPIPEGMLVLHRCDNRPCVRPDHLFLGTSKDNAQDREQKGRGNPPIGNRACGAKLTTTDVAEIRRAYAIDGDTQLELADRFGVSFQTISRVVRRQLWRHVP